MIEEVLKVSFFPDRGADRRRRHRDRTIELPCLGCPGFCDCIHVRVVCSSDQLTQLLPD
jgi:hypothetical protein